MEADVVKYIKEAQKHGLSDIEIKQNLLNAGWDAAAVEESYAFVKAAETQLPSNIDEDIRLKTLSAAGSAVSAGRAPKTQAASKYAEPQIIITEQHFKSTQGSKRTPLAKILGILCLLAVFGGAAYYAYGYFIAEPQRAWDNFTSAPPQGPQSWKFVLDYSDSAQPQDLKPGREFLKDLSLRIEGAFSNNAENPEKPVTQANINITASSALGSSAKAAEIRRFGSLAYININDWKFLDSLATGSKPGWLKIDLARLGKNGSGQPAQAQDATGLKDVLSKEKYLGREQVGAVQAFHYKNAVDLQKLKALLADFSAAQVAQGRDFQGLGEILDRMEAKNAETWIDAETGRLLKIKLDSSAPSISNFLAVNNSWDVSGQNLRNMQRLMDIQKYAEALKAYYKEHGGFPGGQDGQPAGLVSKYLEAQPGAPLPADGTCTEWYNTYWYTPREPKTAAGGAVIYQSYELSFCLGSGLKQASGIARLTPKGIEYGLACNDKPERCAKTPPAIKDVPFTGVLSLSADSIGTSSPSGLAEPAESLDLFDLIGKFY